MAERQSSWGKWITGVIIAAVVIAAGIWHFAKNREDDPQYNTVGVDRGDLTQTVTATGTLNPVTNVLVGCQVSGRISKVYVDYNSIVKAGQLIAELDPSTYKAQLEQAEANLAKDNANLELQQVEARRESELFSNKLVSISDYDTAFATLHEAEASVQLDDAAVNMAGINLGYCKIYSPVDGIVIVNNIEVGQTVAASFNTPELFQIANNLKEMQIDSSVAEADVGNVVNGQGVDFTVDAYPYRTFHGSVTQVRNSPTTVNNVVTYDCVISVTNSDYKLKPGMTANVSIIVAQRTNVLEIPNGTLRFRPPETAVVITNLPPAEPAASTAAPKHHHHAGSAPIQTHIIYVLSGDAANPKLEATQVRTGITDGLFTEVVSGLKEGNPVITSVVYPGAEAAQNDLGRDFRRMR
jgi:HlyD family secretion protein